MGLPVLLLSAGCLLAGSSVVEVVGGVYDGGVVLGLDKGWQLAVEDQRL